MSLPCPSPFISYSPTNPFIIIIFSFSLIIPLSSCLSLLEFRSSPFHPLIALIHTPFLVSFFFLFLSLRFPFLLNMIYPTDKKKKFVGLVVNYTDRGMHRRDDAGGVATPPKMLMRQSIRDFRQRKKFFGVSRRLYQSLEVYPPPLSISYPLKP